MARNSGIPAPIYKKRLAALKEKMAGAGLDSLVTFNLSNVRYLSGYSGSNGAVVITRKGAALLTDFRYASQVEKEVSSMPSYICSGPLQAEAGKRIAASKGKRAGFEEKHLTVSIFSDLKMSTGKVKWSPSGLIEELRMIKDAAEIDLMQRNFSLLEKAFSKVAEFIVPGRSEKLAAARLENALRVSGGEKPAFDFIVASGARAALPHGIASPKIMRAGEAVVLDWGWILDGYNSDNTRTVFLGKPRSKMKEIFDITLEANMRAIELTAPGVPLRDIDAAARDLITKKGYGKYFGHGTGHGVGLDVHEAPTVNPRSRTIAREGMVFTIEPGIYLPGVGGVRIEDMLVVTRNGCKTLSDNIPKNFLRLG